LELKKGASIPHPHLLETQTKETIRLILNIIRL
jgi:hypothetical protein